MMYQILHIFFLVMFIYLSIIICYLLMLAIAAFFYRTTHNDAEGHYKRIAVLITSYKEDLVIVNTVRSAADHDYPIEFFDVFVAAHHLKPTTISNLRETRANIYEVHFEKGSKARSLNFLLNIVDENKYDIAVVLDGDNIMMPGFLRRISAVMQAPGIAAQGHRTAKNLDTPVAVLDALSEEVNNALFRKSPAAMGLSSSLIGSGMAFPISTLKEIYGKPGILDNPACDREVDFELLVVGHKVKYVANATILDEKVSKKEIYETQRKRWIESQLMHIRLFFSDWSRVRMKTADFWHKLFINLIPPRMIMLALFAVIFLVIVAGKITDRDYTGINPMMWLIIFIGYFFALILAIPAKFFNLRTLKSFIYLPVLLFSFVRAALTARSHPQDFVHTPKTFAGGSGNTETPK